MTEKPKRGRPVTTGRTTKLVRVPIEIESYIREYIKRFKDQKAWLQRERQIDIEKQQTRELAKNFIVEERKVSEEYKNEPQ